ncbi:hypothetical protein [Tenacibaculum geojense]|uniref:Uncharacterized protein n=1 Tax=Tenacibaculum geojense TaxID=915352 RepID=A0ABW3JVC7_9FLAO
MSLKSLFFYQRRFILTLIYIIAGLIFISFSIMAMLEPSQKSELHFYKGKPEKLTIEYKKGSKDSYLKILKLCIKEKEINTVINNRESELLTKSLGDVLFEKSNQKIIVQTPIKVIELSNSYLKKEDLNKIKVEVYYSEQVIKEIKINDVKIVVFEENSRLIYIVVTVLGLLWLLWQFKILFSLIKNKPEKLYK